MKKLGNILFYCILLLYLFGYQANVFAAEEPAIVEKYVTEEGAVFYVKNLPNAIEAEHISYQVGGESCVIEEATTLEESSEQIYTLILCDTSMSAMRKSADQMKEVLKDVVANRMANEKFAVMGMGKDAELLCDYTNDYLVLKELIDNITEIKQKTYVYSSLYQAIEDLDSLGSGYKRILVISDAVDSGGVGYGKAELEKRLEATPYPVYALGISGKDNQADLQALYAISRATNAEYFTLNETENLLEIVQALSKDYGMERIVVKFPKSIMDGSTKNSQLKAEINGEVFQAQTQITLPFADASGKIEEAEEGNGEVGTAAKEEGQEDGSTEGIANTGKEDKNPEENTNLEESQKTKEGNHAWLFLAVLGMAILLCILIILLICISLKNAKNKKENLKRNQGEGLQNPYKELDKKLAAEEERDISGNQKDSEKEKEHPVRSGETKILGNMAGSFQERKEENHTVIGIVAQHTIILKDIEKIERNWKFQFAECLIIGRKLGRCDLAITDDKTVSEKHCEISIRDGLFYIEDLNSSNGTKINGSSITPRQPVKISSGTILEIGQSKYQVRLD